MSESNVPRTPGGDKNEATTSEVTTELNVESVEAIGQEATTVAVDLPPIGTTATFQSLPGQRLELSFDATQAQAAVNGADLILSFDLDGDGTAESQIVFLGLAGDFDAGQSPLLIIDGTEVASEQLINLVLAQAGDLPLETAAGAGAGPIGGGGSRYSDDFGSSIDLLNAQGVIPPTELNFGLLDPIPDIIPLPVGTPPLADNVVTPVEFHDGGEEGGEEGSNILPSDLNAALEPLSNGDFQGDKPDNFNTKLFKQLDVNGSIGDDDGGEIGTFGGSDAETALEDLVFTLLSEPEYGSLILVSDGTSSVMSVGDTFDSTDTVWWIATSGDIEGFEVLPDPVFDYSVTDADGNVAEETVTITIEDTPNAGENATVVIDDDDVNGGENGNPGGIGDDDPDNVTGTLDHSYGLDGAGSLLLLDTGAPAGFSYAVTLGGTLLTVSQGDTVVMTVTLDDTTSGGYTVEQVAPISHPSGSDENNVGFTVNYRVTDSDGDFEDSTLAISVDDDTPTVSLETDRGAMLVLDESLGDGGEGDPNADDEDNVAAADGAIGYAAISGGDLFDIDASAGSDGEKSTVYTLTLSDGDSGLFDTESGEEVVLSTDSGDIIGMADGAEVFRISVDEDTGAVEVNQFRALVHGDEEDHDESDFPAIMNPDLVDLTVTLTDGDDDTDSDSIELGTLIKFEDDGPSVSLETDEGAELVLDESLGDGGEGDPNADDETNPDAHEDAIGYAAISGDDLFDITADAGTDGEESRVYTLTLNGGDSGLFDTESGEEVELSMDGDDIVGMADGEEVFRISVDEDTGAVEVNQFRALEHDETDHDESGTPAIMNSGLVDLTVTLTDGDKDTASSSIELGTLIKFEDDGPEIDVKVAAGGEGGPEDLVMDHLDESIDEVEGFEDDTGNDTPDPTGNNAIGRIETSDGGEGSGDLGALFDFTKDAGTDGEDSLDHLLSFTLTGADPDNGVETALFVTQPTDGPAYFDPTIVLFVEGDEIVGKFQITEGVYEGVALRIGIENPEDLSNATLFVEQYVAIDHDGDGNDHDSALELLLSEAGASLGVTLTSTLTDGDDDVAVDSATVVIADENSSSIVIEDDGPQANNDNVGAVAEDTAIIIDVFDNDEPGTDGVNIETGIFLADAPTKGTAEYNGDGTFTYTPFPGAEGPDSFTYTIMDGDLDGDTTTASVTLVIEPDSIPTVTSTDSSVREAALPDGTDNLSGDNVTTGSFTIDTGDDTIQKVEVKDGNGVWQNVTGGGTVDGDFGTLEVFEDGDVYTWEYTLITNTTTHTDPSETEADDIVPEDFMVRVIDSDDDESVADTFTIDVLDDGPLADDDGLQDTVDDNVVDENIGTVTSLLLNDNYGADGAHDTESFSVAEGDLGGTITVDGDNLLYTSATNLAPGDTATETFTYTIKDADGDTITATFTVDLTDEGPTIGTPVDSEVDEEGLSGNAGDSYGDGGDIDDEFTSVSSVDLDIDFGVDGAGDVTFDDAQAGLAGKTSGGDPVSFVILDSGALIIGYTGAVPDEITDPDIVYYATLSESGSGSYDFTLLAPLDHDLADTEDDNPLTFAFTATDAEGEGASSTFTVTVDDDAPLATDDGLQDTVDDNVVDANIGSVSGLLTNDFYGADGEHDTDSFSIAVGDLGGTITIDGDNLLYTSATNLAPGDTATETFTYTIKDADGDTITATFTVDLTDEGPTIGTPTDSAVDEEGLLGGNANDSYLDGGDLADEDTFVSSVDLDIDFGSDGAGDVTFDGTQTGLASKTSKGDPVSFVILAGGTLLIGYTGAVPADIGDADVVYYATLSDTGSGSYDFTLLEPLDHDLADTEDDNPLTFAFTATDAEGEAASSTFTVTVDDDAPLQLEGTDGNSVYESELDNSQSTGTQAGNADDKNNDFESDDTVITGDISTFASFGADGAGSSGGYTVNPDTSGLPQGLMSKGDPVVYAIDGTTLWAYVENGGDGSTFDDGDRAIFSFVLLADGTWTFTLIDQIDHIAPYDTTSIELDLSSAIMAMDGDGDSVILGNSVYITVVSDDVPNDIDPEDGFVGNAGGGTYTGDLDFIDNQGADEGGDVQFNAGLNNTLLENAVGVQLFTLADGDPVTLLVQDDGHTLLATTNPGDPLDETSWVFVAELDPVTDTYDITMHQALDDGSSFTFEDFSNAAAGNNSWIGIDDPRIGGANLNQDLLFTGLQPDEDGVDPDTVNTSNTGVGTNSQAISVNDGMRIDYLQNINIATGDAKDLDTLTYDHHYTVNDASYSIVQTGGPATNRVDTTVSVYDADDDQGNVWDTADDPKDDITTVSVYDAADILIATWMFNTGDNISGETVDNITVTWDGGDLPGDVLVEGLLVGFEVFISTDDGFNRMEVINTTAGGQSNDTFDLGGFQIDSVVSGSPIDLSFDLDVTDFDGDVSDGDLDFTVLPQLTGTDGNDILISNGDPEVLIGGLGDDIMTGGLEGDIFVFDVSVDEGNDQILDFSLAQGDLLSFTDVVDAGPAGFDVTDVIASFTNDGGGAGIDSIELVGGTTILLTDLDGAFNTDEDIFNASLINGNL